MKKQTFLTIVLTLLCGTILVGCGIQNKKYEEKIDSEEQETITYEVVETTHGNLQFPDSLKKDFIIEQTEDGENLIVSFKSEINEEKYQLFDITIGELEQEAHGTITDATGTTRNIYIVMYDVSSLSKLTEDEKDKLYALQEEINTIISFLE